MTMMSEARAGTAELRAHATTATGHGAPASPRRRPPPRRSWNWNDPGVRTFTYQLALAAVLAFVGWYLYDNVATNLRRQNIATGFSFLGEAAKFNISETPVSFTAADSYGRALLIGLLNTIHVSLVGIVCATLVGVVMGIARASRNLLVSKLAGCYVEFARNVPVILHVVLWSSIIRNLPAPRQALDVLGVGFISNRGLTLPVLVPHPAHGAMGLGFLVGAVAAVILYKLIKRHGERTGRYVAPLPPALALVVAATVLPWLLSGAPVAFDMPKLRGFGFSGGMTVPPEFFALVVGLTVYTGAFIAEIVRAGIESVPKGQSEAARALGLKPSSIMSRIVLPQALRVIIPPMSSQFLSLTKNSSLGVIIGYPELVNIGNTIMNQTGQVVEMVTIMMIIYLGLSLTTSISMNLYNNAVALKER